MIQKQLIQTVYKSLEYACFLKVGNTPNDIINTLQQRNWECIELHNPPNEIISRLETSFPTIFHYSYVDTNYTNIIIEYIKKTTNLPGWQKRFILIGFEFIDESQQTQLEKLYYTKVPVNDGSFFIHSLYQSYLWRR